MMNLETIRNLPSKSLLPRSQDVTHIATIGAQMDLDRSLVAGEIVGWSLADEMDSWVLYDAHAIRIGSVHSDFCGRVIEMAHVDEKSQTQTLNVNLMIELEDGQLCAVHAGGTLTTSDWDKMMVADMDHDHLVITHHRFSTSSEKYGWLNEFRGFGVCRLPTSFSGSFTIPLYQACSERVLLSNGADLSLELSRIGKFGLQVM